MLADEATGQVRWVVQAHAGEACVAMSPKNGRFVASVGSKEEKWKLWDVASGAEWMAGARHDGTAGCICRTTRSRRVALDDGCPAVAHTAGLLALAFSPCGRRLATGGHDGAVILWDAGTGEPHQMLQKHTAGQNSVRSLAFSADGALLASGGDGPIRVRDATTGALLHTISVCADGVCFSPTNPRRLASHTFSMIRMWDLESGELCWGISGRTFAAFSPDGCNIATAGGNSHSDVKIMDHESFAFKWRGSHPDFLTAAAYSLDGSKLALVSYDGTCKVWDSRPGRSSARSRTEMTSWNRWHGGATGCGTRRRGWRLRWGTTRGSGKGRAFWHWTRGWFA